MCVFQGAFFMISIPSPVKIKVLLQVVFCICFRGTRHVNAACIRLCVCVCLTDGSNEKEMTAAVSSIDRLGQQVRV